MRNIVEIIEQIVEVAPDLESHFSNLKCSALYSPPEMSRYLWVEVADVLNLCTAGHPKKDKIQNILTGVQFGGTNGNAN